MHAESGETEAYVKEYVEVTRGEPVCLAVRGPWQPGCSGVSSDAKEAFITIVRARFLASNIKVSTNPNR